MNPHQVDAAFKVERLPLDKFIPNWLPGLQRDGLFVGMNWSGDRSVDDDVQTNEVTDRLTATRR
ncbi:DUF2750 domain-containing protein [Sphingobium yanoikuyae]|uniref:DUF2750 domain-containing protein n=1 Tax=Sphingobium yanoikuyae TaxID=13690 RepID=A0A291N116_SPHYA|nr:hypothetical protein A6768_13250 [Sphingobium yanoikuyae]